MSAVTGLAGTPAGVPARLSRYVLLGLGLAALDALALWLGLRFATDGNPFLGGIIVLTAALVTIVGVVPRLWPLRWTAPALALIILMVLYPTFYTLYIAFTNYSDGHRFSKQEAIALLGERTFLPETGTSYSWTPFRSETGEYALWLTDDAGNAFFALPGEPLRLVIPGESGEAQFDENGVPTALQGYRQLERGERFRALSELQGITFGEGESAVAIKSRTEAGAFEQKWVFVPEENALLDRETNIYYYADDSTGDFVAPNDEFAPLGYWVPTGLDNFARLFRTSVASGPFIRVFAWTVSFAALTVVTSFAAGLVMALVLNQSFTGVRAIRSLLVIPYAVPGMISILIWRGMLNPNVGVLSTSMEKLVGWSPPFFTDAGWAKFAVLLVNLWLTYPYFMLICSGALQSISPSIYEAAQVDGANSWERFRYLTLPLLLVAVGPLLIASFTFNFNNFLLIEGLFQGGPPMVGTAAPPVGHTDNLISYTFRFAFSAGGRREFGFASAIAVIIFLIVGALTLAQFRLTKRWEETGENV